MISRGPSSLDLLEGAVRIKVSPVDSSIGGLTTGKLDKHLQQIQSWETHYHNPIGSMYAIYGNIYHQYIPNVSIYTSTMDPMGMDS